MNLKPLELTLEEKRKIMSLAQSALYPPNVSLCKMPNMATNTPLNDGRQRRMIKMDQLAEMLGVDRYGRN